MLFSVSKYLFLRGKYERWQNCLSKYYHAHDLSL